MKKDFLLEILVQELPYKFIPSAILQLKSSFEKLFKDSGLDYGAVEVYATPRRLAVLVNNLSESQQTVTKDIKGPVLSAAKTPQGDYSQAAIGFARKNNVDTKDLYEKDNYIYAKVEIKGKTAQDVLKDNVENIILKLQGPHFMRWGYNTQKFSRPIENIVALLDNEVIDLSVFNIKATNKTQGHRYSKNRYLTIDEPRNYVEILKKGNVFVNQEQRRKIIVESAQNLASKNNLTIDLSNVEELLEEITYITEYPVCVLCEFDKKYLKIPSIVTTTVMIQHQRYLPLWDDKNNLSNHFITIANYVGSDFSNIQRGNQRVITARLEDAVFFFEEDNKTKLIDKIENLSGMTFQKGFGTLFDKTNRLAELAQYISGELKIEDNTDVLRCAKLAKCDLSTKLVFEFTELQGFIGENYALLDGEKETVARGVKEHYFPLCANSELPAETTGQIVSIADKIDTICALFLSTKDNKKKRPTGSNDPLGARRAAIGIIRTIIEKKLNLDLDKLIKFSLELLSKEFSINDIQEVYLDIKEFFTQRLVVMFESQFSINIINSVLSYNPLVNLEEFLNRAKVVLEFNNNPCYIPIKENALRIQRILKNSANNEVKENLFVLNEEKELYKAIVNHTQTPSNLAQYIESLNPLNKFIVEFFDKVLVMDKDEAIKTNRLSLLNLLRTKYNAVCDFEKL